ncbi:MAG TPA: glycosyltransferase [Pyrinomonadaceae bacterium]|nr:glycosyltransferase [Pyrinomonadaceae bacterium]
MRLAVFTSKYPARVATFFERDMRALLEAGVEIDVFPIYPLDSSMWDYSHGTLNEEVLSRDKIHHLGLAEALLAMRPYPVKKLATFIRDLAVTTTAAIKYGPGPFAKTSYAVAKAWAWAQKNGKEYDHVLAYWGNYAATSAYAFHRLLDKPIPLSIWLHAGADLYDTPVYLRQKLLYADQIVTCCAFNRKFLAEHHADIFPAISEKIHVCYHGLDFPDFPYRPEGRESHRIVAVGRLSKEKGFSYLLRALHQLISNGTNVELELVGDGEEAAALKRLAEDLQIADRVTFSGWLKFEGVKKAIGNATILVHPSDGLGDGLPNVIREAMALGTPVIASDIAGIHEALDDGNCGMLVPPRDVQSLVTAIKSLLSNSEQRLIFAERARKRAEDKFDMWRNGRSLAALLRTARRRLPSDLRNAVQPGIGESSPESQAAGMMVASDFSR